MIVVGSGVAGLSAVITALLAPGDEPIVLLTKQRLEDSATDRAQGGIAVALGVDDSAAEHAADTLAVGCGISSQRMVELITAEGPAAVLRLVAAGCVFDRDEAGGLARGLEAAHRRPRILHAGGDATGHEIERALLAALDRLRDADGRGRLAVLTDAALIRVCTRDGQAVGVDARVAGLVRHFDDTRIVLATGGAGQLYPVTSNPVVSTGDGIAAAWRAGAAVADLEFVQFHPTVLAVGARTLVSEAVRGVGAVLRDADGHRFMPQRDARAELAPRDVVAHACAEVIAKQDGQPVLLDTTTIDTDGQPRAQWLAQRFPTISAACTAAGVDWSREPVPVSPAAHYLMGGIVTDDWGRTSVPGLCAAGECARTGLHGANRLASNSLLEGLVMGARVAEAPDEPAHLESGTTVSLAQTQSGPFSRAELQRALWQGAGPIRDQAGLEQLADTLAAAPVDVDDTMDARALEDRSLALVGRLVATAAIARTESRGAHRRTDFPETDPTQAHSRVFTKASGI